MHAGSSSDSSSGGYDKLVALLVGCLVGGLLLMLLAWGLAYRWRRPHHSLLGRVLAPGVGKVTLLITGVWCVCVCVGGVWGGGRCG